MKQVGYHLLKIMKKTPFKTGKYLFQNGKDLLPSKKKIVSTDLGKKTSFNIEQRPPFPPSPNRPTCFMSVPCVF